MFLAIDQFAYTTLLSCYEITRQITENRCPILDNE